MSNPPPYPQDKGSFMIAPINLMHALPLGMAPGHTDTLSLYPCLSVAPLPNRCSCFAVLAGRCENGRFFKI